MVKEQRDLYVRRILFVGIEINNNMVVKQLFKY